MFKILKKDEKTDARLGILETNHRVIETPAYAIVGTYAKVRTLNSEDLLKSKTQLIIVNTYHMWRDLKDEGLADFPGLHKFMNWNRLLMTDSGGFQVFSLRYPRNKGTSKFLKEGEDIIEKKDIVRITENGVYFTDKGGKNYLDAEKSIEIQQRLGADIIFALDECTSPSDDYEYTKRAMERTHRWAVRSLKSKTSDQLLFGIVQGGLFEDLRKESAKFIAKLDFDGFGIGGAFGASLADPTMETFKELEWIIPNLPELKPRHLLGVGKIDDLFKAVSLGIDILDCVIPTREGRHGAIWISRGRFDINKEKYKNDKSVIDESCNCPVCSDKKIQRNELRELFKEKNLEAGRLASLHNVYFFNDLMEKIRKSISEGRFLELKNQYNENSVS